MPSKKSAAALWLVWVPTFGVQGVSVDGQPLVELASWDGMRGLCELFECAASVNSMLLAPGSSRAVSWIWG